MKVIKRIDFDPEFVPVHLPNLIEHEVFDGVQKASEIIRHARLEAARIRQEAQQILTQARDEKEAQKKKGYEVGLEEGRAELSEKIIEAAYAHEKVLNESESQIVEMVIDIAEKVIGKELKKGAIKDIVKKSISQIVGKKIVVRVNPADLVTLREKEKELIGELEGVQSVSFREDEEIGQGGCVVESEMGTVDARLETQWAAIKKAFGLGE